MSRSYNKLIKLKTFIERYEYLKIRGIVGEETFGFDRYLNQILYSSNKWKKTRDSIIIRDNACDLAMDNYSITSRILIHHINPITVKDVELDRDILYDHDNLVCTSMLTHNSIHFGDKLTTINLSIDRKPNDTCPWHCK